MDHQHKAKKECIYNITIILYIILVLGILIAYATWLQLEYHVLGSW